MTLNQRFREKETGPPLDLHHRKLSKARLRAPTFLIPADLSDGAKPRQCGAADLSLAVEGRAEKGVRRTIPSPGNPQGS